MNPKFEMLFLHSSENLGPLELYGMLIICLICYREKIISLSLFRITELKQQNFLSAAALLSTI